MSRSTTADEERRERLAAALRANLRRRKAQARGRRAEAVAGEEAEHGKDAAAPPDTEGSAPRG